MIGCIGKKRVNHVQGLLHKYILRMYILKNKCTQHNARVGTSAAAHRDHVGPQQITLQEYTGSIRSYYTWRSSSTKSG